MRRVGGRTGRSLLCTLICAILLLLLWRSLNILQQQQQLLELDEPAEDPSSSLQQQHLLTVRTRPLTTAPKSEQGDHLLAEQFSDLLPHLSSYINQPHALEPSIVLRAKNVFRSPAQILVCVPSAKRSGDSYLISTLLNLTGSIAPEERATVHFLVVLVNADVEDPANIAHINTTLLLIEKHFWRELAEGMMEVIVPPAVWYPSDLESIAPTFNDTQERMVWRVKQNLDYAYAMIYATRKHLHFKYFLQLEDDLLTVPNFITGILTYERAHKGWAVCEFSALGMIGKLFRRDVLISFYNYILLLYKELPVDWVIGEMMYSKYCYHPPFSCRVNKTHRRIDRRLMPQRLPALFQHVGRQSSLPGKIQKLKESRFVKNARKPIALEGSGNPQPVEANGGDVLKWYAQSTPLVLLPRGAKTIVLTYPKGALIKGIEVLFAFTTSNSHPSPPPPLPPQIPFTLWVSTCSNNSNSNSNSNEDCTNTDDRLLESEVPHKYLHHLGGGPQRISRIRLQLLNSGGAFEQITLSSIRVLT